MNEETTEQQIPENAVLEAIADLGKSLTERIDKLESRFDNADIQFEAIRSGIAANNIAFERLAGKVYLMSANLAEMQEEMRHHSKETII